MASFLKGLRGNGEHSELRELAKRINGERQSLEDLITRADVSSRQLGKLTAPIPKLGERLAVLERQLNAIEGRVFRLAEVQTRADQLHSAQREIEKQLANTRGEVARTTSELAELGRLVNTASNLRRELGQFCELERPLRALQGEAVAVKGWLAELAGSYRRLRTGQEELSTVITDATSRVAAVEQASQAGMRDAERYARRVEQLEQRIAGLADVAAGASDTKHQLLTLKSLADQIIQKTAALENQRDAMERAAKDVSRLDALVQQVDGAIREQENQISKLHSLARDVDDVQSIYESVMTRWKTISNQQQQVEERERATRQKLAELGEQLGKATERFDLEHRGLETVSERVTDLRAAVKACEHQMEELGPASRTVTEVATKADKAWVRLGFFLGELEKLNELPERMRVMRNDVGRLQDLLQEVSTRSTEIETAKPAVDEAVQGLAGLGRAHETIKEAVEQLHAAQAEMARVRETQGGTDAWLKTVQESVADLQGRVRLIDAAKPTIEWVRRDVERILEGTEVVTSHRPFLDDVQSRLAELASLAAQLDDRTKAFRSRLDIAEGRFVSVTRQAEETEQIAIVVSKMSRTVAEADARVAHVAQAVVSLETRTESLENVPERVRLLHAELERRQAAMDKASEHVALVSALRQEAAEVVQRVDERVRWLRTTLVDVEDRAKRLEVVSGELDGHAARVRSVEGVMKEFESQLGSWEVVRAEVLRTLDELESRRSTVNALHGNISEMFEMAERTANDLKAAAEAQREIRESRASLDDLLVRLREADAVTAAIDLHRQEMEHAERRLARAQALLLDIQSSLEMLNNQKAQLDQVIEVAGALTFQIQQGESLVDRLRKERDITNTVRTSLEDTGTRAARAKRDA